MRDSVPGALELACPTSDAWLQCVLGDFRAFLRDHASNEKKASGMALSIASHYPDRPQLLLAMADLAVEELRHYRDVVAVMIRLGVSPGADLKDPYVNAMNAEIRRGSEAFFIDRMLVAAIVERRGHERFSLLAEHLDDKSLQRFYRTIALSEDRHWQLFLNLVHDAVGDRIPEVTARLGQLIDREGAILSKLEIRPALH